MCLVSIILSILLLYPYTFAVYEQLDLFLSLYKYMSLYLLIPYICGANCTYIVLVYRSDTMASAAWIFAAAFFLSLSAFEAPPPIAARAARRPENVSRWLCCQPAENLHPQVDGSLLDVP